MTQEIFGVQAPREKCTDKKCPFHGTLGVKRELFKGRIIKRDTNRSATMEWMRTYPVPKYERYELRRSRIHVHNPPCIDAKVGQSVLAARVRPLSKTKHHVILGVLEEEKIILPSPQEHKKQEQKSAQVNHESS